MNDFSGPAFPSFIPEKEVGGACVDRGGLTIRQYYAAKAMQAEIHTACISKANAVALAREANKTTRTIEQQIAFNAFLIADAMLAHEAQEQS